MMGISSIVTPSKAIQPSIITERLINILIRTHKRRLFTAYALANRAKISTSSLSKLLKRGTLHARIKFVHAALLFENLSVPLEDAVKAADYNDPHLRIEHRPTLEGPVFTHADAETLLINVMIIFVELFADKANAIGNRRQLALKLKKNPARIYRGFPAIDLQTGQIKLPLKPPIPEMENLNQMAIAFGTTLSKIIKTAKKRIKASRTQEG